jgi:3-hydroxyisobutyrate dehydrogenase-like beta-hydroxyacid dehydrogenase
MFATLEGVHEALGITRASGVSDDAVLRAVATGTGDTWVGRNWGFFDKVASAYTEAGVPVSDRPWSKDLWEVVSAGRDAELSMPLAGLLAQIMATVIEDHAANPKSTNGAVK